MMLYKTVVNWFQIVFLREQSQAVNGCCPLECSCELISNCIFTWAITSVQILRQYPEPLWIDFKLYFYVSNHKILVRPQKRGCVVNWFQIVFLREQSQAISLNELIKLCCELISNCIFTWAITSNSTKISVYIVLWIDFKLYFYVSNHKLEDLNAFLQLVVNWFQIVFLREQSQGFKTLQLGIYVVNWFQIVFLREQSQVSYFQFQYPLSCELISNCIFTWAITRFHKFKQLKKRLWIDFKLYFYVSNHKIISYGVFLYSVVNWFQIVFLREQSQDLLML